MTVGKRLGLQTAARDMERIRLNVGAAAITNRPDRGRADYGRNA
jgi:hypothetical protein